MELKVQVTRTIKTTSTVNLPPIGDWDEDVESCEVSDDNHLIVTWKNGDVTRLKLAEINLDDTKDLEVIVGPKTTEVASAEAEQ